MKPDLRGNKDFWSGIMLLVIGLVAGWIAQDYKMGTVMRMGSGYFPTVLGGILASFGLFLTIRAVKSKETAVLAWGWWPLACITASMLAFGFLLPRLGLVPALAALFFTAAAGGREFRAGEVLALTGVMTAFAVAVFVYLLKLPLQLFPGIYFL